MALTDYGSGSTATAFRPSREAPRGVSWSVRGAAAAACCFTIAFFAAWSGSDRDSLHMASSLIRTAEMYESGKFSGARLARNLDATKMALQRAGESRKKQGVSGAGLIEVDTADRKQEILGFGGAFTDAAAINFYKLPKAAQDRVVEALYGESGLGYSIGRIPMNSCDFSIKQYNYDNVTGDFALEHFDTSLHEDSKQRIPMMQEVLKVNPDVKFFISPWSPPGWMKEADDKGRQSMIKSNWPQGLINTPEVKGAWALYFSKFVSALEAKGIDIWGLTVQNEPENPGPWEACVMNATFTADFVGKYLGPQIRADHPEVKIMVFDHNRDHLLGWAETVYGDPIASEYVDGMAFHWYFGGMDRGMDGSYGWGMLNRTREILPEGKFMLSSESCHCPGVATDLDGEWYRAEHTAHDILSDLSSWTTGWVDWNLLLDAKGGPNHAGNLCDTPIVCLEDHSDIRMSPLYYYMAHITKFVKPGSVTLGTAVQGRYNKSGGRSSGVLLNYEATTWPCEGSIRQAWRMRDDGKLEMQELYTENMPSWEPVCLSATVMAGTDAVVMALCDPPEGVGLTEPAVFHQDEQGRLVTAAGLCLMTVGSSSAAGAVTTLGSCDEAQAWEIEGDLVVRPSNGHCLTAGWPFFSAAAFSVGDKEVLVVLNEGTEKVEFDIRMKQEGAELHTSIDANAMQTYVM
ncbi:unnamed protein product [Chrysoparadoxa australica]